MKIEIIDNNGIRTYNDVKSSLHIANGAIAIIFITKDNCIITLKMKQEEHINLLCEYDNEKRLRIERIEWKK